MSVRYRIEELINKIGGFQHTETRQHPKSHIHGFRVGKACGIGASGYYGRDLKIVRLFYGIGIGVVTNINYFPFGGLYKTLQVELFQDLGRIWKNDEFPEGEIICAGYEVNIRNG